MDRESFVLHKYDIRDSAAVQGVIAKVRPAVVFHLAAVHFIPACEAEPGDANSINVSGTINLLNAVPPGTQFVFASTAAVYRPSDQEHTERDDALGPVDIDGYTKLHAENFVRYFHQKERVRAVIVRLFNVVGPGETNPHLVPTIIGQLASGTTSLSLGNLFPHRDYIDVSDAARGFRELSEHARFDDGPLVSNLGTGTTHSVRDVVEAIAVAAGVEIDVRQDLARMRPVDRPMLKASTRRLAQISSWIFYSSLPEHASCLGAPCRGWVHRLIKCVWAPSSSRLPLSRPAEEFSAAIQLTERIAALVEAELFLMSDTNSETVEGGLKITRQKLRNPLLVLSAVPPSQAVSMACRADRGTGRTAVDLCRPSSQSASPGRFAERGAGMYQCRHSVRDFDARICRVQ